MTRCTHLLNHHFCWVTCPNTQYPKPNLSKTVPCLVPWWYFIILWYHVWEIRAEYVRIGSCAINWYLPIAVSRDCVIETSVLWLRSKPVSAAWDIDYAVLQRISSNSFRYCLKAKRASVFLFFYVMASDHRHLQSLCIMLMNHTTHKSPNFNHFSHTGVPHTSPHHTSPIPGCSTH